MVSNMDEYIYYLKPPISTLGPPIFLILQSLKALHRIPMYKIIVGLGLRPPKTLMNWKIEIWMITYNLTSTWSQDFNIVASFGIELCKKNLKRCKKKKCKLVQYVWPIPKPNKPPYNFLRPYSNCQFFFWDVIFDLITRPLEV